MLIKCNQAAVYWKSKITWLYNGINVASFDINLAQLGYKDTSELVH